MICSGSREALAHRDIVLIKFGLHSKYSEINT